MHSLTFVINGKFLSEDLMGISRYAREMVKALDRLLCDADGRFVLVAPRDAKEIPDYRHIRVVKLGSRTGILWEQLDLGRYLRRRKDAIGIHLCNVVPFFARPGITTVHDIMYRVNKSHYTTLRNRVSRYWHMLQYRYITSHERVILTDSQFSQGEIERYYPRARAKINVIPCGWQHVLAYRENLDWQLRYPFAIDGGFYFSLATLSKNKNGKWILGVAKRNPNLIFAVAGKYYETDESTIPNNVHFLGFIPDADACALMKHCKAFLFPSLYEGFGLPPLEALALGAQVISSNAAAMPEVLGNCVHYVSPDHDQVNLDVVLAQAVHPAQETLNRFSWERSAQMLLACADTIREPEVAKR